MATLEEVLAEATKNGRVCPLPWTQLYDMLPDKRHKGGGWEPALPLILAAWADTPAMLKMLRVREHIEWAASHGCLDAVFAFLRDLPETSWLHLGE